MRTIVQVRPAPFTSVQPDIAKRHLNLLLYHRAIATTSLHELFVSSSLRNPAAFNHTDQISSSNGAESMSNDECGSSFHQAVHGLLHIFFIGCVQVACGFIENQDLRISQKHSGDGDTLSLAP